MVTGAALAACGEELCWETALSCPAPSYCLGTAVSERAGRNSWDQGGRSALPVQAVHTLGGSRPGVPVLPAARSLTVSWDAPGVPPPLPLGQTGGPLRAHCCS